MVAEVRKPTIFVNMEDDIEPEVYTVSDEYMHD